MHKMDRMHWQLTLVRERVNPDTGATEFYSVPDTAANRNAGRFPKMAKPRDQKFSSRGAGVTHGQKPLSRAVIERRMVEGCAKSFASDSESQIVTPELTKRMARLVKRSGF